MPRKKKYYKRELCFETEQEREAFDSKIMNLKYKTGIKKADELVMLGLDFFDTEMILLKKQFDEVI